MDLPSLAVVLRAALSHVPEERKAAEESLNQVSCPSLCSAPLFLSGNPVPARPHCLIAVAGAGSVVRAILARICELALQFCGVLARFPCRGCFLGVSAGDTLFVLIGTGFASFLWGMLCSVLVQACSV